MMRGRERISNETVEKVPFSGFERESGFQYSAISAQAVSHDLSLPWSTVRKILRSIQVVSISFVQQRSAAIFFKKRSKFCNKFLTRIIIGNECPWKILCFDETQFTLDGAVNNQNCRIWCGACPYVVHERSLHSDYTTV